MILNAGQTGASAWIQDLWTYDFTTEIWNQLANPPSPPSARGSHSIVFAPSAGSFFLFGGYGEFLGTPLRSPDLWQLTLSTPPTSASWSQILAGNPRNFLILKRPKSTCVRNITNSALTSEFLFKIQSTSDSAILFWNFQLLHPTVIVPSICPVWMHCWCMEVGGVLLLIEFRPYTCRTK